MPKAVVCRELGPPERLHLETFASAPLVPGQVRVAIHAAGINFPDILMAAGEYQLKPELPFTPGVEAAGEVSEVAGGVAGVAVGDRVIVKMRHGAYADEAVVAPSQLTPLPSTFDYAEGATFLAAHGTAYHALIDRGQVKPGEVLLVHGAGGGVGLAAVEMGKNARRNCGRGGVIGGKAGRRASARRRSSGAVRTRAVPRRRQAHHRWPRC
jgi:NADPH2:quinone reductase